MPAVNVGIVLWTSCPQPVDVGARPAAQGMVAGAVANGAAAVVVEHDVADTGSAAVVVTGIAVAQGQMPLDALITHELPLEEWKRGFDLIERREGLKVVLKP